MVDMSVIDSEEDKEEVVYKLIGSTPDFQTNNQFQEISINSPIGNAIYHKKIGDIANIKIIENHKCYTN